jgi:hypothetical protein
MRIYRKPAKKRRSRLGGTNGSVSVFFIVITAAVFMLMAVFIDYARIAVFNKQVGAAAQAGVRSVLSAYDSALYERYGLFGRGGSEAGDIFTRVVKSDLEAREARNAFRLTDVRIERAAADPGYALALHPVFRGQILEDMKYKAPIDFTMEIADRFRPVAGAVKQAGSTVKLLEKLRKLYELRQRHLSSALSYQREAADALRESGIAELIPAEEASGAAAGAETALGIADGYGEYASWLAEDSALGEEEEARHGSEIAAFRQAAVNTGSGLLSRSGKADRRHADLQQKALAEIAAAEADNAAMESLVREVEEADTYSAPGLQPEQNVESGDAAGELRKIRGTASQVLLPAAWFLDYREEIGRQSNAFASIGAAAGSLGSSIAAVISGGGASQAGLQRAAANLKAGYIHYAEQYLSPGIVISSREDKLGQIAAGEGERKKQEALANSKWREAGKTVRRISSLARPKQLREAFEKLGSLYKENAKINAMTEGASEKGTFDEGSAGGAAADALSNADGMFDGIKDMLESIRDELYINEYAAHRFRAFTPQNFKALIDVTGGAELAESLSVNKQEVEYILYGLEDPVGNLAAAYGEIFAFRLAVRMMEGLVASRGLVHPLAVLAAALVYGLEKSMEDMALLLKHGTTPLSKYADVQISYLDYLRMFLLAHGNGAGKMSRMIGVIEYNTGYDLAGIPAGVSGEIEADVNLWFIPGLIKMLGYSGILQGKVVGSRYETTKTAAWSY